MAKRKKDHHSRSHRQDHHLHSAGAAGREAGQGGKVQNDLRRPKGHERQDRPGTAGNAAGGKLYRAGPVRYPTYRDADLPDSRAAAVKLLRAFIKALRQHRKARGQDLKYIYTTEEKHGEARLHHHLVISSTGADIEVIRSLWPLCGRNRHGVYRPAGL